MANSVLKDKWGPDWPLGITTVVTSGTPVGIMKVVDPNSYNAPETATPATSNALNPSSNSDEETISAQQIIFRALKSVGPVVENTGAIYILRAPSGGGTGNKTDSGVLVMTLQPGQSFILGSAARNLNVYSPYRYFIDSDSSGDGCSVTLIMQ